MGSLALGGGEGLVHGTPLNQLDGRAIPIKQSLEMAAETLATGQPVPQSARDLMARPTIPTWLYRFFGGYGWKQQAKRWGVQKQLRRRPYENVYVIDSSKAEKAFGLKPTPLKDAIRETLAWCRAHTQEKG